MTEEERETLTQVIRSLMFSENGGDVHEAIDTLCDLAGIGHLEGDFLDGWTDEDKLKVGA